MREISVKELNKNIGDAIKEGRPMFAGRYGGSEMTMMDSFVNHRFNLRLRRNTTTQLYELSGFFPNYFFLQSRFTKLMIDATKECDIQAIWGWDFEKQMLEEYYSGVVVNSLAKLEPYYAYREGDCEQIPWTAALKGKKVLVIHPFDKSIRYQYDNHRLELFEKTGHPEWYLPEFELITYKAIQTIAGNKDPRFKNWFEALEYMENEIKNIDFDVAIIGCGAYGYPLGAYIKKLNKVAIHMGGATQLMFGVSGNRWMSNEFFKEKLINDAWKTPFEEEKPENALKVEKACYW